MAARLLPLSRVAFMLTGDWHLAEDLVQNTLIWVARHWEGWRPPVIPTRMCGAACTGSMYRCGGAGGRGIDLRPDVPDRPLPDTTNESVRSMVMRTALAGSRRGNARYLCSGSTRT
ncbi:hypothetical protein WEI85_24120 [Actinomycetes bacterium KLBMP 9797]